MPWPGWRAPHHHICNMQAGTFSLSVTVMWAHFTHENKQHTCSWYISVVEPCRRLCLLLGVTNICGLWCCHHLWSACKQCLQISLVQQAPAVQCVHNYCTWTSFTGDVFLMCSLYRDHQQAFWGLTWTNKQTKTKHLDDFSPARKSRWETLM